MTIRNYLHELRCLFSYYPDKIPQTYDSDMVTYYLVYLNKTMGCSRAKCHMAAQSISFFFKHVLQTPYVIPSIIYPRKSKTLPAVMSQEEILKVINTIDNVKHRTIVMMLYSTGIRLSELVHLRIADIDSKNMRIKVVQGKGAKDRYTILSQQVLLELRVYYIQYKPIDYLFNGSGKGSRYSHRSIQAIVEKAIAMAGLKNKDYSVHTIRHSFATHLVDNGTDVHTVKELLGHNSLGTTMQYLHISQKRTDGVANPYDLLTGYDPITKNQPIPGSLLQQIS